MYHEPVLKLAVGAAEVAGLGGSWEQGKGSKGIYIFNQMGSVNS